MSTEIHTCLRRLLKALTYRRASHHLMLKQSIRGNHLGEKDCFWLTVSEAPAPSSLLWACGSQSIIARGWVKRSCSPLRSQEAEARIRRFWEQTQPSKAYSLLPPTSPAPWSLTHPPVNSPIDELANEVSTLMTRSPLNSATDRTPSLQHMNL